MNYDNEALMLIVGLMSNIQYGNLTIENYTLCPTKSSTPNTWR